MGVRTRTATRVGARTEGMTPRRQGETAHTANLRTNIVDFRGFDSSIILSLRVELSCP